MRKFQLNEKDIEILRSFLIFPWLTPRQVCDLHYSNGSFKYVEARLAFLTGDHYLKRRKIPHTLYGYFYAIDLRGIRLLEEKPLFYPSQPIHIMHVPHFLMTNEVMIAALNLSKSLPFTTNHYLQFPTLTYIYHDFTLKHMLQVAVPDVFVEFRQGNERIPFCFEIHLQTGERKFKAKIRAILDSVRSEYRDVFGTNAVTWAFLTPYPAQFEKMIQWTEQELSSIGSATEADLFRFAVVPEKNIDPYDLYCNRIHRIPFTDMFGSLL